MKSIYRALLSVSVLITASTSCSVVTTTIRGARTADLGCDIMQIPTVAELEVDGIKVCADTTWSKDQPGIDTKKNYTDNLIASILEASNADILLEPKVDYFFNGKQRKLTVSGFPARYGKFRTATMEDVRLMNELKKTPRTSNIVLANGVRPVCNGLSKSDQEAISMAKVAQKVSKTRTPYKGRKRGYKGFIDASFGMPFYEDYGYSLSTTHGYQFNQNLFLGAGVSYANIPGYDEYYFHTYADFKAYMTRIAFAPYWDVRLGSSYVFHDGDNSLGLYLSTGLGFSIGHVEIGVNYNLMGYPYLDCMGYPDWDLYNVLTVTLGVHF